MLVIKLFLVGVWRKDYNNTKNFRFQIIFLRWWEGIIGKLKMLVFELLFFFFRVEKNFSKTKDARI